MVVHVAQQVADDALGAREQRVVLDVAHQPVQPPRDAGQHPQGKSGVALDLRQHRALGDAQHEHVREGLRVHDVGPAGEHQRLGEGAAGPDDLDHLLLAAGRDGIELHLADHGDVELLARLAHAEYVLPAREAPQRAALGDARQLRGRDIVEQRQGREVPRHVEARSALVVHGAALPDRRRAVRWAPVSGAAPRRPFAADQAPCADGRKASEKQASSWSPRDRKACTAASTIRTEPQT